MIIKLLKSLNNCKYEVYYINVDDNFFDLNILYKLFNTKCSEIKTPDDKILFEISPISNNTPWSSNVLKICEKCNFNWILNVKKTIIYFVDTLEEGKEIFEKNHDRMTETYSKNITFSINTFPEIVFTREILNDEKQTLDLFNKINIEYGLSLESSDLETIKKHILNVDNQMFFILDLAQSNSEHCRHHFFNGEIILDNIKMKNSLFELVKKPLDEKKKLNKDNHSLVAFSDNSSVIKGFKGNIVNSRYKIINSENHFVLTAETHNFPTGIAPFQGASTGIGGRIRDVQATGIGAKPICSSAGYCVGNIWEYEINEYPLNMARPLDILIKASDGASDYGNKFGEPIIVGFTRSFKNNERKRVEWIKPIMFTSGLGLIRNEHLKKKKLEEDMLICKIGGPPYKIGLGGGAASSRMSDDKNSELDFSAVQRDDAEMEQKMNKVIEELTDLSTLNPIISIHDQGAGGNGNVLKEIIEDKGAIIDLGKIKLGDKSMNDIEIWSSEYQESNALVIENEDREIVQYICDRENVNLDVVGKITGNGKLNIVNGNKTIVKDYPMNLNCKRKTYTGINVDVDYYNFYINDNYDFENLIKSVLQMVQIGSKRFLTNKVDRSVGGLIAQQQCVGPLHTPLSNYGLMSSSFIRGENGEYNGCVTAIGEQPILSLLCPVSMVHKTFAEMLTNMMFVLIDDVENISCSANWMWPCPNKYPEETNEMYVAMLELSDLCSEFGIIIDGGKDSLSMAVKHKEEVIKCPGSLVLTGYAKCPNINKKVTPDLKMIGSKLYYVDLSQGENSMGGSSLSQYLEKIYTEPPYINDVSKLKQTFKIVQRLIKDNVILSGHDKSDGGLITTLLEMSFAGNIGIDIKINEHKLIEYMFNEEIGIVIESQYDIKGHFSDYGIEIIEIGRTIGDNKILIRNFNKVILSKSMTVLRQFWERPSYLIEKKQCLEKLVNEENKIYKSFEEPTYQVFNNHLYQKPIVQNNKYNIAIIREEGSNSYKEMGAAFLLGMGNATDINSYDLIHNPNLLDEFNVIAFVGGFSFADTLGSAHGWYNVIQNNENIKNQFDRFYSRTDTYSLGVCNGCQLMVKLGIFGDNIKMERNESGRFESRFSTVQVESSVCHFTKKLNKMKFGIWVAHGEGRFVIDNETLSELNENKQIVMRYVDFKGNKTQLYPHNPNGSTDAIAGICSKDGRHLALMPHPERSFLKWQLPWCPVDLKGDYTPWFNLFRLD